MELALLVWFASSVGGLTTILGTLSFILCCAVVLGIIAASSHNAVYDDRMDYPFRACWGKWCTAGAIVLALIATILPSEKTIYLMLGAYTGQKIIQSETAGKVLEIVNLKIDDYLEEAKKEKAK
jgi:hypothetical protein